MRKLANNFKLFLTTYVKTDVSKIYLMILAFLSSKKLNVASRNGVMK
jgi:hypothetical protein